MPATKLYIGNLPDDADKDELEQLFRKYGNVVEFDVLKEYGFIHYELESEAKAAAAALDGHVHRGVNIKVEMSRSKVRQKAGMGGKGECYRCGEEGHWSKECPRGPTRSYRGRGRGRGDGGDRYSSYDRDPYYPEPYDYYARARLLPPPIPYDRYRYDPYERRLPPPRDYYRDPYPSRSVSDYYRRSPPLTRDPYYDHYERRRYDSPLDGYGDKMGPGGSSGASGPADVKPPMRPPIQGRVPGPY